MKNLLIDVAIYALSASSFQLAVTLAILLLGLPFSLKIGWQSYLRKARRLVLFMAFMLLFGALGQAVWMVSAYGRLYVSADAVMGDFVPFLPFGLTAPDFSPTGNARLLHDAHLWQLQLLWLLIAAPVWTLATIAYHRFAGHRTGRALT